MEERTERFTNGLDGFETLALSLQMAVKESFELPDETLIELKNIESQIQERQTYEMWLYRLRLSREPGLQKMTASALCSGDVELIEDARERAQFHAKNRAITDMARAAVQRYMTEDIRKKPGSNSTMSRRQLRRLMAV